MSLCMSVNRSVYPESLYCKVIVEVVVVNSLLGYYFNIIITTAGLLLEEII